ncbi:MAG: hypothetical protein IJZ36_05235 [Bacilli bacterium]|nr:hypothetical protein [Bacilli bacterium]
MKLIVGLGNIGNNYNNTRHNIGFMAIDKILNYYNLEMKKEMLDGMYVQSIINNEKVSIIIIVSHLCRSPHDLLQGRQICGICD